MPKYSPIARNLSGLRWQMASQRVCGCFCQRGMNSAPNPRPTMPTFSGVFVFMWRSLPPRPEAGDDDLGGRICYLWLAPGYARYETEVRIGVASGSVQGMNPMLSQRSK